MQDYQIVTILKRLGSVKITPRKEGKEIEANCPLSVWTHSGGSDRRPSFYVSCGDGPSEFFCHACKAGGRLITLIRLMNKFTRGRFRDIEDLVENDGRETLDQMLDKAKQNLEKRFASIALPRETEQVFSESELNKFKGAVPRYALKRGFSLDVCRALELGYDVENRRLVFPIRNAKRELVGLVGRAIQEGVDPKYFNYWNFQKSKYLYGEHLTDRSLGVCYVVEGMTDVAHLLTLGYRNVLGIMGSLPSVTQAQKIAFLDLTTYIMFDGDKAGLVGARELMEMLGRSVQKKFFVRLPFGTDPGNLDKEQLDRCIDEAEIV